MNDLTVPGFALIVKGKISELALQFRYLRDSAQKAVIANLRADGDNDSIHWLHNLLTANSLNNGER